MVKMIFKSTYILRILLLILAYYVLYNFVRSRDRFKNQDVFIKYTIPYIYIYDFFIHVYTISFRMIAAQLHQNCHSKYELWIGLDAYEQY